ncbi:YafY family protein [Pelosinus sp. UFO1]|uniref:helix-turn-helix transcriptional regulator n=1 Tax=Pelosinus sp. UFO1 TaxID=484770 RepID=UPI0004D15B6B|nr:WYL domain-containing protein [Pelosinus sp. UFO1]AIF53531.1 WYL domain containing protein [Pelosinus sp. UFO1]
MNLPFEVINVSNSEKLLRLLKIISLIEHRRGVSLNNLVEECDVCERTIYRDLDALNQSGLPVYLDEDTKRYRFMEKVFLRPLTFTVDEATAVLACLQDFSKENNPLGNSLRVAQEKVLASLPHERQCQVDKARKGVDIRVTSKPADVCQKLFICVEKAIEQERRIKIRYYTKQRESETERKIDPYVITFRGSAWYLIAYCHLRQAVLMFRMDRIKQAEETTESFHMPKDFSIQAYFSDSWLIERGELVHVKLRFLPEAARWVRSETFHPSQRITELDDGAIIFEATVNGRREISRWILGYGPEVEVLEPEDLRLYLMEQTVQMAKVYS